MYYTDQLDELTKELLSDESNPGSLYSVGIVLDFHSNPEVVTYIVNTMLAGLAEHNNCVMTSFQDPMSGPGVQVTVTGTMVAMLRYLSMAQYACTSYVNWVNEQYKAQEAEQARIEAAAAAKKAVAKNNIWGPVAGRHRADVSD